MRRHDLMGAKKTKGTIYMDEAQFHKRETADGGIISNRPLTGKVKSIKGNTVSWNQLLTNNNFESTTKWRTTGGTITASNNELSFVPNATPTLPHSERVIQNIKTVDHTYYVRFDINPPRNTDVLVTIKVGTSKKSVISNTWNAIAYVIKQTEGYSDMAIFVDYLKQNVEGDIVKLRNVNLVDLTLIYGAGLEPSTPEQFEADYKKWFGKDLTYEPYDAGSLRSVTMEGFKSVGFNLLNLGVRTTPVRITSRPNDAKQFSEDQYWPYFTSNGWSIESTKDVIITDNSVTVYGNPDPSYGVAFPIKCSPNTKYYYSATKAFIRFFDSDGKILDEEIVNPGKLQTPENCEWMVLWLRSTTEERIVVNPIVNLDSSLNGTYITGINPSDVSYDVTAMQGRLNGEGELVTPFAEGLMGLKTLYRDSTLDVAQDEITIRNNQIVGIKRIVKYTLKGDSSEAWYGGTEATDGWGGTDTVGFYSYLIFRMGYRNPTKIVGFSFARWGVYNNNNSYEAGFNFNGGYFNMRIPRADLVPYGYDPSQANALAAFKAYLQDKQIECYFALETPEEYVMEANALEYRCTRGGSEEVVGSVVSPTLEIEYEH